MNRYFRIWKCKWHEDGFWYSVFGLKVKELLEKK